MIGIVYPGHLVGVSCFEVFMYAVWGEWVWHFEVGVWYHVPLDRQSG